MNSPKTLEQTLQEARAQVVATIDGRDYTRGELQDAFDRVANADHWKAPINSAVECSQAEVTIISYAVMFFTGAWPTVRNLGGSRFHFEAAGYWNVVGS